MANDNQNPNQAIPEGLDEFLTSDDPQSTAAAQGFQALGQAAPAAAQAVGQHIDQNLQAGYQDALSAAHGDPEAQERVAQRSLGTAMAGIQGVGSELPLDQASRLARAKEMGFDTSQTYYHGTPNSFERFKITSNPSNGATLGEGIYITDSPDIAETYAGRLGNKGGIDLALNRLPDVEHKARELYPELATTPKEDLLTAMQSTKGKNKEYSEFVNYASDAPKTGSNILPLHTSASNTFDYLSEEEPPKKLRSILLKEPELKNSKEAIKNATTQADISEIMLGHLPPWRVTQILEDLGYDSAQHAQIKVIFDPKKLRSVYGTFDPTKASSANLSHAQGGMIKSYADGGEVVPEGLDAFLSSPTEAQPTADRQPSEASPNVTPQGLDEFIKPEMQEAKYGGLGQQAIAGLEGFAQGVVGPLAPLAERALGVNPEDIRAREEANPVTHYGTEALGLAAGIPTGLSEEALAAKLGPEAFAALGPEAIAKLTAKTPLIPGIGTLAHMAGEAAVPATEGASYLARVGSAAAKAAIENSVIQAGNETTKMILQDPNASAQTAIIDTGLAGLIGAGFGGIGAGIVSPLWKAVKGSDTASMLGTIANHAGGIEGQSTHPIDQLIDKAGVEVAPEIRAAMKGSPRVQQAFQILRDSATGSGIELQEALKNFRGALSDAAIVALGKSPEDMGALTEMSEYEAGKKVQDALVKHLEELINPISAQFEEVTNKFKDLELPHDVSEAPLEIERSIGKKPLEVQNVYGENPYQPMEVPVFERATTVNKTEPALRQAGALTKIADDVGQLAIDNSWVKSPSSPEMALVNRVLKELPLQKTLEDLRNFQSMIGDEAARQQLWNAGKGLSKIFRSAEEAIVDNALAKESPELLAQITEARKAYRGYSLLLESLNDRLHVGMYSGPKSFLYNLKQMAPEDVLRRLSPKGDAGIIGELSTSFPNASKEIQDYYLNKALRAASKFTAPGESVNLKALFRQVQDMSPEMRKYLMPEGSLEKIQAIKELINAIPEKIGKSGTPQGIDGLMSKIPQSAIAMISMLTGHSPITSAIVGKLTGVLGREAPDAARLSLLKYLGSSQPVNGPAFKGMFEAIHNTIRGESLLSRGAKNLFKAGREVLPQTFLPTDKDTEKLDKVLKKLQVSQNDLMNTGKDVSHYMPEHAAAMGQTATSAVNYLNSLRPVPTRKSPLDPVIPPNEIQKANYQSALKIAQQPLSIFDKIQSGTLSSQDIGHLKTLYPALYARMADKVTREMMNSVYDGGSIPYQTRLGLSLFLGQPLDSTMTPQAIMAAQPQVAPPMPAAPQGGKKGGGGKASALNKLSLAYQTPAQSRERTAQKP